MKAKYVWQEADMVSTEGGYVPCKAIMVVIRGGYVP